MTWKHEGSGCTSPGCDGVRRMIYPSDPCGCASVACSCLCEGYGKCNVCGLLFQVAPRDMNGAPAPLEDVMTTKTQAKKTEPVVPVVPVVTQVQTNAKAGGEATLGQYTLILGDNGTGKTTLLHALSLALCGVAYDVAGVDTETRDESLRRVLAPEAEELYAMARVGEWDPTDGGGWHRWWKAPGQKAQRSSAGWGAAKVFPVQGLRAVFGGSNETRRKWLGRATAAYVDKLAYEVALEEVPASRRDRVVVYMGRGQGSITDRLEHAAASAAADALQASRDLGAATKALKMVGDAMPNADRLAGVTTELAGLSVPVVGGVTREDHEAAHRLYVELTAGIAELRGHQGEAVAAVAQHDAYLADKPAPKGLSGGALVAVQAVRAALNVQMRAADGGSGACVLCTHDHGVDVMRGRTIALIADCDGLLNPTDEHGEARQARAAWAARASMLEGQLQTQLGRQAAVATDVRRPVVEVGNSNAHHAALTMERDALVRAQAAADRRGELRRQRNELEEAQRVLKLDAASVKQLRDAVVGQALPRFVTAVSAFLPQKETLHVKDDGGHVEIGLTKADGTIALAPSGAEEARLLLAIGAATAVVADHPVILIPDERQWTPATLRSVMNVLETAPCQVVLVSTVKPKRISRNSPWVTVDLNDAGPRGGGKKVTEDPPPVAEVVPVSTAPAPLPPTTLFPGSGDTAEACVLPDGRVVAHGVIVEPRWAVYKWVIVADEEAA